MQQAAALNIAEPWTKVAAPVLVVYGTSDFVTTREDHERIAGMINHAHPGNATLKLVPGMDHHFDVAASPQQAWDIRVKQHSAGPYAEELSKTVVEWLREKAGIAAER